MNIKDYVLKQPNMSIKEWLAVINSDCLSSYERIILECADDYNKIIINSNTNKVKFVLNFTKFSIDTNKNLCIIGTSNKNFRNHYENEYKNLQILC